MEPHESPPRHKRRTLLKWTLGGLGVLLIVIGFRYLPFQDILRTILDQVQELGPWGPAIFIGVYVAATVMFIPGSVLTLGAGALFGVVRGSIFVSIASTLGATCAFLIGRYLSRERIARRIAGNRKFTALDEAVKENGWLIVGLTRLSPVFPFTLLNYGFGLTRVHLAHYVLASWIGMMPGTVMYVYLGSIAKAASESETKTTGEWVLYGIGLAATVAVTVVITRLARRALRRQIECGDKPD